MNDLLLVASLWFFVSVFCFVFRTHKSLSSGNYNSQPVVCRVKQKVGNCYRELLEMMLVTQMPPPPTP